MRKKSPSLFNPYAGLLREVKGRIQNAQARAVLSANAELIRLYWDIGRLLDSRQEVEGWGTGVIPRLSKDLHNEMPELKGFSERNISRMIAFFRAFPEPKLILPQAVAKLTTSPIGPQAVAQLPAPQETTRAKSKADSRNSFLPQAVAKLDDKAKKRDFVEKTEDAEAGKPWARWEIEDSLLWSVPWGHHAVLLEKVKHPDDRVWYMRKTLEHGWSRNILGIQIASAAHRRQGRTVTNFEKLMPAAESDLIVQALKDPYIFDFLTLEEPFHERELETGLIRHLEKFLLELGQGFAFVGRQFPIEVGDEDFYIDLLFYHLKLRRFVVIDLKKGKFKPGYAGKMNFYLNVVDDRLRHPGDGPSIGLILCQDRNRVIAEYTLHGANRPIGVSEYELAEALPKELQSSLPTIEAIEAELSAKKLPAKKPGSKRSRKQV